LSDWDLVMIELAAVRTRWIPLNDPRCTGRTPVSVFSGDSGDATSVAKALRETNVAAARQPKFPEVMA
jgi:hypothetical protein